VSCLQRIKTAIAVPPRFARKVDCCFMRFESASSEIAVVAVNVTLPCFDTLVHHPLQLDNAKGKLPC